MISGKKILILSAVVLIASCSKMESVRTVGYTGLDYAESGSQICAKAGIECNNATKVDLIGVVKGTTFPVSAEKIFAMTAFRADDVPTDYTPNSRINNDYANADEGAQVKFAKPKYYPEEGKLYFYAFSPVVHSTYYPGSGAQAPLATWKITGSEDIMWAEDARGIAKAPVGAEQLQPTLNFVHKLTQLQFKLIQGTNFTPNAAVTSLTIHDIPVSCSMNIINGDIEWGENESLVVTSSDMAVKPNSSSLKIFPVMIKAGITSVHVTFLIKGIEYDAYVDLSGTAHAGEAGYSTLLTFTFSGLSLKFTTELTDWQNVGHAAGNI